VVDPEKSGEAAKTMEMMIPPGDEWIPLLGYSELCNAEGVPIGDMKLVKSGTDEPIDNPKTGEPVVHPDTGEALFAKEFDLVCKTHAGLLFYLIKALPQAHPKHVESLASARAGFKEWCEKTDILPILTEAEALEQAN
jgi:hypothetical protein